MGFDKSFNNNQLRRHQQIIDRFRLRKGAIVTTDELMQLCNASLRTIKQDLSDMRIAYSLKIPYDRKRKGYYLKEDSDVTTELVLSKSDLTRLKMAAEIFKQYNHIGIFKGMQKAFEKIEDAVTIKSAFTGDAAKYIQFEDIPYYQGTEHIGFFLDAIQYRFQVQFEYLSYKSDPPIPITHIIEPYAIKEHTKRWYVIGHNIAWENSISSYALDRVLPNDKLQKLETNFVVPSDFSLENYFKYTYGMTTDRNAEVLELVLEFPKVQAKYFKSKPFFKYEPIKETEEKLIVKMKIINNFELRRKLISFGKRVKVLSPPHLVAQIKKELEVAAKQYEQ